MTTRYDLLRQGLLDNPNVRDLCSDGTINNNYRPSDFLQLDKAQIHLAEYVYNCMSLRIWVLMFLSQQLYQKTIYYQQEYYTISKYWSYLCSLMLILFLSLTLPWLDRHLLAHREGDAPPRVKEITEGQRDHSGAARRPQHAPLATGKNTALALLCLSRPSVNLVRSVWRRIMPLFALDIHIVLVFLLISCIAFCPLILYIVFDIILCHYLLLYIRTVLVFLLISYIAFVTKLYHCLLYNLLRAT